jgi:glutamine amidotransferase
MIIIIDADLGNLRNVEKAFQKLDYAAKISSKISDLKGARALVLPGVGHFGKAMENLNRLGLVSIIREKIKEDTICLGICLGMQLFFETSAEAPGVAGLSVLKGTVKKFSKRIKLKIPQIGWNNLKFSKNKESIFQGLVDNEMFYFVHSYYVVPEDKNIIIGQTHYGFDFAAAVRSDRLWGVQFHPEKSGARGLKILDNFGKICARGR